jgi:hypothetical protein
MQEALLFAMLDSIVAAGSGLAYPSQTLYLTRDKPALPAEPQPAATSAAAASPAS